MLKQRVITAVVLVAVFLSVLLFFPPWAFYGLVAIVFTAAAWEWSDLASVGAMGYRLLYSTAVIVITALCLYLLNTYAIGREFFIAAAVWWCFALLWVQGYPSSLIFWHSMWVRMLMGLLTLVPAAVAALFIFTQPNGYLFILSLLLIVAAADTGAYFSGKAFGRRKLAPNVSPGKSWEGVIGGLFLVTMIAVAHGVLTGQSWFLGLCVALPAAAISVLGDLLESMLKRHRGVKDSGTLLPGHGGVLDRIDGITAAAPVFALAVLVSGWKW